MELRTLVIDDEEGMRKSLTRVLAEDGYSASVASNGEEALCLIRNYPNNYGIVIRDLLMPGIDWITTIKEINKLHGELTTIIFTGYNGTLEYSIKAIETGITGFITKSFENRELDWKEKECYLKHKMEQFISHSIFNELLNNDYFQPMCDVIINYGEMIDKYIGVVSWPSLGRQ